MNDPNIYLIMGVLFLGLSAFFFWNVGRMARQSAESVNWPHVDGQITKSEIREDTPGEKWFLGEYTYAVQGVTHKGSINSIGPGKIDFAAMQNKYPTGLTVPVYYNPSKPSVNTVEPGARSKPQYMAVWVFVLAGLICLGIAYSKANG